MAVAFVQAVNDVDDTGGDDTLTTITVGSGANRCLVLCVASRGGTNTYTASSDVDGAFTSAIEAASGTGATNRRSAILYLLNPSTGNHSVTVSATGVVHGVYTQIELTGVDQSTPVAATDSDTATGGGSSSCTPTAGDDDMIVDSLAVRLTGAPTVGADQTQRSNAVISPGVNVRGATSTQPGDVSGDAMTWTYSNAQNAQVAVAFAAAAAASVPIAGGLETGVDYGATAARLDGALVA